jgi:hypothetical protein
LVIVALGLVTAGMHQAQLASFDKEAGIIRADLKRSMKTKEDCVFVSRGFVDEYDKHVSQIISGIIRPMQHFQWYYNLDRPQKLAQSFETGLVHLPNNDSDTVIFDAERVFQDAAVSEQAVAPLQGWLEQKYDKRPLFVLIGTPFSLSRLQKAFTRGYCQIPAVSDYLKIFAANDCAKKDTSSYIKPTRINIIQQDSKGKK